MKSISILSNISNILKIKLVVFILCCLIGSFLILYYYKYINFFENTIVEGFNTSAPPIERKFLNEPVRFASFYGGNDWFHLNSLLFFDDKGQLLRYGEDYKHYSTDGFGWWGAQDYRILFNNNPDQKNTYYHSASTNCTFVTVFTHPQSTVFPNKRDIFLSRIYIRNRLAGPNSGNPFQPCSSGIHYRIKNYNLRLFSVVKQSHGGPWRVGWNHNHEYNKNIFEYRLGDDGNLMRGSYDVMLNLVDPAMELKRKSDALAKTAQEATEREDARQKAIEDELNKVSVYAKTSTLLRQNSSTFLINIQKYTTDTIFMTYPIGFDVQTTDAIKKDSIIQVSRNDMKSNVETTTKIVNNLKKNKQAIEKNLDSAIIDLKFILSAYNNIISQEPKLSASNTILAELKKSEVETTVSKNQTERFKNYQGIIGAEKLQVEKDYLTGKEHIMSIINDIQEIISSEKIAEQNLETVQKMYHVKKNLTDMYTINTEDNKQSGQLLDATSERKQNNPESILSNGIALGALV